MFRWNKRSKGIGTYPLCHKQGEGEGEKKERRRRWFVQTPLVGKIKLDDGKHSRNFWHRRFEGPGTPR